MDDYDQKGKSRQYIVGLQPGVSLKLLEWLFLDASVGKLSYRNYKYTPDVLSDNNPDDKSNTLSFDINYVQLGLSVKIGK